MKKLIFTLLLASSLIVSAQEEEKKSFTLSGSVDTYFRGNISGGNLITGGRVIATGNLETSAQVVATGNLTALTINGLTPATSKFIEDLDMPAVIGEFHMGTTASGFFHPGLVAASSQEDRARMYVEFMNSVIDNNNFVGAHWFQYLDSPITGRAYDGENYNIGFVSVTDTPYQAMIDAAKKMHAGLYQRRFGELATKKD